MGSFGASPSSHPTPQNGEQVPETGHCRVGTSAACCHQRGLLALPWKQQLLRHGPWCSGLCKLSPLSSAGAQTAGQSTKSLFLWTI